MKPFLYFVEIGLVPVRHIKRPEWWVCFWHGSYDHVEADVLKVSESAAGFRLLGITIRIGRRDIGL